MHKLPSSFDAQGAQFAWDSTSLKAAFACPRLYFYTMIGQYSDGQSSVHLIFGGLYAKALETYHKLTVIDGATHNEALRSVVRSTMIESWVHNLDANKERRPGTGHAVEFHHSAKTRENLIRTIIWYLEEFKNSDFKTMVAADGRPAVEFSFKIEADNNIILCGHNDRIVEYDGSFFVQDQKTTGGTVSAASFEAYDMDIQMSLYTFAGKAIYSAPIKGVMIDIAQVAVCFSRFMRGFTYRTEDQLEEFYTNIMAKIKEIRYYSILYAQTGDMEVFPMNFTACGNYGGCPFRKVCRQPRQFRQKFLDSNISKRAVPWNPLENRD